MRAPVAVRLGVAAQNSYIGVNRRELTLGNRIILGQNPWGPFNPEMTVLSFCDLEGKNIANIVHYGMHGTCAGINHEISRDWSGVMIDALEDASDGITAFFNGPEGDVGPRLTNGATTGISGAVVSPDPSKGAGTVGEPVEYSGLIRCSHNCTASAGRRNPTAASASRAPTPLPASHTTSPHTHNHAAQRRRHNATCFRFIVSPV
jgi:hypothetical protein